MWARDEGQWKIAKDCATPAFLEHVQQCCTRHNFELKTNYKATPLQQAADEIAKLASDIRCIARRLRSLNDNHV